MAKPPIDGRLLLWGSWTGNALLTILAVYVAATHAGPLMPGTILTIAVCLLSGNLLPLGAHTLLYFREKLALMAERAQAGESVRKALSRLAEAETRLTEARDASAKATLVARQIPDRIDERFEAVSKAMQNLDAAALANLNSDVRRCIESLAGATDRIDELTRGEGAEQTEADAAQNGDIRSGLDVLQTRVEALAKEISDLGVELRERVVPSDAGEGDAAREIEGEPPPSHPKNEEAADGEATAGEDPDWSVHTSGTVDFSDEDDPFDGVEDELRAGDAPIPATTDGETVEPEPATRPPGTDSVPAAENPETPSGGKETVPPPARKKRKPAKKQSGKEKPKKKSAPDDAPPELFSAEEVGKGRPPSRHETILEAHAMIGIQNKLFLRGDPPLLDWERGVPLKLTGIGEYQWKAPDMTDPLHCKLLLNDERWAIGENLVLQPGRKLVTRPKF